KMSRRTTLSQKPHHPQPHGQTRPRQPLGCRVLSSSSTIPIFPGNAGKSAIQYPSLEVTRAGCLSGTWREPQAMPTVGERIKTRRAELGWTQDQLAERAGISKSFVSDVENGKRSIGADTLLDVGRAMGVSLDFLMTGKESGEQQAEAQIPA